MLLEFCVEPSSYVGKLSRFLSTETESVVGHPTFMAFLFINDSLVTENDANMTHHAGVATSTVTRRPQTPGSEPHRATRRGVASCRDEQGHRESCC